MKKKIFLVTSSLAAGGAQKVFWLLSQGFDKKKYEVTLIILTSKNAFFSTTIPEVNVLDLGTSRSSLSIRKFYNLIKKEKPYAIFGTGDQINFLISFVSMFVDIPYIIGRPTNISSEMRQFAGVKSKVLGKFKRFFYDKFNTIVCQSDEIRNPLIQNLNVDPKKMVVIPNPVLINGIIKNGKSSNRLVIVGRLTEVKGHARLLNMFSEIKNDYSLTLVGDGPLKEALKQQIDDLGLTNSVFLIGNVSDVINRIADHDVLILSSFSEGFPNVVLESLSVGVPVVTFRVGGVSNFIENDFNGYIVEQGDLIGFKQAIMKACAHSWDAEAIKRDIENRFSLKKVAERYEQLIES